MLDEIWMDTPRLFRFVRSVNATDASSAVFFVKAVASTEQSSVGVKHASVSSEFLHRRAEMALTQSVPASSTGAANPYSRIDSRSAETLIFKYGSIVGTRSRYVLRFARYRAHSTIGILKIPL
ncbi:hypothetical protein [Novipirellula artificiosorum]|uniref:Uncharacterized protein n=1 Tax=Novipirellula artificiosorum TaxID=2528016 RepID=A0A5C6D2E3_9BACT|nr:hypothetical protein [Novipirellula artificiosorum]TWU31102.1 hypothetical protein Poly41_62910 [Novipirellula artificiosorum]